MGSDSNLYLITGDFNILIDAGTGSDSEYAISCIREILGDSDLDRIILTHCHFDHAGGVPAIVREFGCRCYVGEADAGPLSEGDQIMTVSNLFGAVLPPIEVIPLSDGDIIDNGSHRLRVIDTPGHTPGSICLYDEATSGLFSGDTVFTPGIGRTDLPGGSFGRIAESVRLISKLNIIGIYPGHGDASEHGNDHISVALRMVNI